MLVQNYIHGPKEKNAEVHKDDSGAFSVKMFRKGRHISTHHLKTTGFEASSAAHKMAQNYLQEGAMEDALAAIERLNKSGAEDRKAADAKKLHTDPEYAAFKKRFDARRAEETAAQAKKDAKFETRKPMIKKPVGPIKEDSVSGGAPTNSAGSGGVAGIGVGPQGEPGVNLDVDKRRKNRGPILIDILRRKTPGQWGQRY
jgi:hypothetical protein